MSASPPRANAITIRSRLMLEIASELVTGPDWGLRQVKVSLREQGAPEWALSLYGSGTMESFEAVMRRELNKLQVLFTKEYLDATGRRCIFAQERFDVITNHGLNSISESEAMDRALAEERVR